MNPLPLTTPRLVLRELRLEDAPDAQVLDSDPLVVRYMSNDVVDESGTRAYLAKSIAAAQHSPRLTFDLTITEPGDDRFLGRVGLRIERPEHREAQVWFSVRRDRWGQGVATEALKGLLDFAFGELALHRVYGDCDPRNLGSAKVMEHVGMKREGWLRENWWVKGEWCDSLIYGLLEHEWKALMFLKAKRPP